LSRAQRDANNPLGTMVASSSAESNIRAVAHGGGQKLFERIFNVFLVRSQKNAGAYR